MNNINRQNSKVKEPKGILEKTRTAMCQTEQKIAAWLNSKTRLWSDRKKKIVLLLFLAFFSTGYVLILCQTITHENKSLLLPAKDHIHSIDFYNPKDTSQMKRGP